jgi:hypothetical protein
MSDEDQLQPQDNCIGFVPTVDKKAKHECAFNPFPNLTPYYKRNDTDHTYLILGCQCGAVKEVMVQNLC